jgi:hypothetical protein
MLIRSKIKVLLVGGWFVPREKYCCLVIDKSDEQGAYLFLAQIIYGRNLTAMSYVSFVLIIRDIPPPCSQFTLLRTCDCLSDALAPQNLRMLSFIFQ